MGETLPPLTVRDQDGNPHVIPVYTLEFSGATITRIGPTSVRVMLDSGGGGTGAPTNAEYLTYGANATLSAERVIAASDNITIVSSGTSFLISATTGSGSGTPGGSDTNIQVNSQGAFSGFGSLVWQNDSSIMVVRGDIRFKAGSGWTILVQDQDSANTVGNNLIIQAGKGSGTEAGGILQLNAGNGGSVGGLAGNGGDVRISGGSAGEFGEG